MSRFADETCTIQSATGALPFTYNASGRYTCHLIPIPSNPYVIFFYTQSSSLIQSSLGTSSPQALARFSVMGSTFQLIRLQVPPCLPVFYRESGNAQLAS